MRREDNQAGERRKETRREEERGQGILYHFFSGFLAEDYTSQELVGGLVRTFICQDLYYMLAGALALF